MTGHVRGYVVRAASAVHGATVLVVAGPGAHVDLAPITDQDGSFALDDVAAGLWDLRADGPDGGSGLASVRVWDRSLSDVTIELGGPLPGARPPVERRRAARLIGRVTDSITGQPVADAAVLIDDGPGPFPDAVVETDADGVFEIPLLPNGEWALRLGHEKYWGTVHVSIGRDGPMYVAWTVLPAEFKPAEGA